MESIPLLFRTYRHYSITFKISQVLPYEITYIDYISFYYYNLYKTLRLELRLLYRDYQSVQICLRCFNLQRLPFSLLDTSQNISQKTTPMLYRFTPVFIVPIGLYVAPCYVCHAGNSRFTGNAVNLFYSICILADLRTSREVCYSVSLLLEVQDFLQCRTCQHFFLLVILERFHEL